MHRLPAQADEERAGDWISLSVAALPPLGKSLSHDRKRLMGIALGVRRRLRDCQTALLTIRTDHHFEHVRETAALQRGGDAHGLLEGRVDASGEGVGFGGWHRVSETALVIFYGGCVTTLAQKNTGK